MKVILAKHSGFCFGVQKAIEKAFEEMDYAKKQNQDIYSLGPLIHNKQVVDDLQERGLILSDTINEIQSGSIIIRSHGVPKQIYKDIKSKGLQLIDTTCPFVKRIQKIVDQYHRDDYTIVIVGSATHPEVIGINGWCSHEGYVIQSPEDIHRIPSNKPLCIVSQTTMPIPLFENVVAALKEQHPNIKVFNTICLATQDRQEAALELSQEVDAMIVIGGRHSSNTQKLVELCRRILPLNTYAIEQSSDLDQYDLSHYETVGITAGASTPNYIIEKVIEKMDKTYRKVRQIAIDGPAGAGKSTIARMLAKKMNFLYIDTGAMYRAITLKVLKNHVNIFDQQEMHVLLTQTELDLKDGQILLDGQSISDEIRTGDVTENVSKVAAMKEVRTWLVEIQQRIASENHVVMDGRDIGTVVLPNADLKIFLTASVEERARRRYLEIKEKYQNEVDFDEIKRTIQNRDFEDENREIDPLIPAADSVHIDTTQLSIEEVVQKIQLLFDKNTHQAHA